MNRTLIGIDYSITSPAMCVSTTAERFTFSSCKFYYIHKKLIDLPNVFQLHHIDSKDEMIRFDHISETLVSILDEYDNPEVLIENYSMGSKGRTFQIGENTGILKYKIFQKNIPVSLISPTEIKKFATGKGNSNKEAMYSKFLEETGVVLTNKEKVDSPYSDIVDSYFICKRLWELKNLKD